MSCCLPPKLELLMDGIEHAYTLAENDLKDLLRDIITKGSRRCRTRKAIWYRIRGEHKERNKDGSFLCYILTLLLDNDEIPVFYSHDKHFLIYASVQLTDWLEKEFEGNESIIEIIIKKKTENQMKEEEQLNTLDLKNFYFK